MGRYTLHLYDNQTKKDHIIKIKEQKGLHEKVELDNLDLFITSHAKSANDLKKYLTTENNNLFELKDKNISDNFKFSISYMYKKEEHNIDVVFDNPLIQSLAALSVDIHKEFDARMEKEPCSGEKRKFIHREYKGKIQTEKIWDDFFKLVLNLSLNKEFRYAYVKGHKFKPAMPAHVDYTIQEYINMYYQYSQEKTNEGRYFASEHADNLRFSLSDYRQMREMVLFIDYFNKNNPNHPDKEKYQKLLNEATVIVNKGKSFINNEQALKKMPINNYADKKKIDFSDVSYEDLKRYRQQLADYAMDDLEEMYIDTEEFGKHK